MSDFITAFAQQQLRDLEQVQRDFGRRRPQDHRHADAPARSVLTNPARVAVALARWLESLDPRRRRRGPLTAPTLPLRPAPTSRHRSG